MLSVNDRLDTEFTLDMAKECYMMDENKDGRSDESKFSCKTRNNLISQEDRSNLILTIRCKIDFKENLMRKLKTVLLDRNNWLKTFMLMEFYEAEI